MRGLGEASSQYVDSRDAVGSLSCGLTMPFRGKTALLVFSLCTNSRTWKMVAKVDS